MLKKVVRNYQIGSSYYAAEGQMLCTEQGPWTKVPPVMDISNKKQTIMIEADYVTCTQWPHGYIGKKHITSALSQFHKENPDVALAIDVVRHPFSFHGANTQATSRLQIQAKSWHQSLIEYTDGTEDGANRFEKGLEQLGRQADITFRFDQFVNWHPIESQRMMKYFSRTGNQEKFIDLLNFYHFELGKSASRRSTILEVCNELSLEDSSKIEKFLNSDELSQDVWQSYKDTTEKYHIHSIPLFIFHVPSIGVQSPPFRQRLWNSRGSWIINGSASANTFITLFEDIKNTVEEYNEQQKFEKSVEDWSTLVDGKWLIKLSQYQLSLLWMMTIWGMKIIAMMVLFNLYLSPENVWK